MPVNIKCDDLQNEKFQEMIIKRLPSRRNAVYLIKGNLIVKKFADVANARKEYLLLKKISSLNINAPKPLLLCHDTLVLSYIPGYNLGQILDELPERERLKIFEKIGEIIGRIYSRLNISLKDVNLRNFVLNNNELFIIDLEDYSMERIEETLGDLILSMFHFNFRVSFKERIKWLSSLLKGVKKYVDLIDINYILKCCMTIIQQKINLHPELSEKFYETRRNLIRAFELYTSKNDI